MAATEQNAQNRTDISESSTSTENSTPRVLTSASLDDYTFPPHYHFPPFFTLQPNLITRASQLASWTNLILHYASRSSPRIFRITTSHTIFTNSTLKRALIPADAKEVLRHMVEHGRAAWLEAGPGNPRKSIDDRAMTDTAEVWLYWYTPEEWAQLINDWVEETGQRNTILTIYELTESDATKGQEFHGLPFSLAKIAIQVLTRRGKAQIIGAGDDLGFKVF